jgi:hypothetical protein
MSAEIKKEIQLEIAHVLFIDIVGYSKLSINEQAAASAASLSPRPSQRNEFSAAASVARTKSNSMMRSMSRSCFGSRRATEHQFSRISRAMTRRTPLDESVGLMLARVFLSMES